MLSLPPTVRIWLATRPSDLCKSFDGLSGLVQECFSQDLLNQRLTEALAIPIESAAAR